VRVLGLPIVSPDAVANRILSEVGTLAQLARTAPRGLERVLEMGEEFLAIGHRMLDLGERIDRHAEALLSLGDRIDARVEALMSLGERIDGRMEALMSLGDQLEGQAGELLALGREIRAVGDRIDARGAQIVDSAAVVADTGAELVHVMPTLERAIAMTTPLEGAIDRFGRLVDRLPGGTARRRGEPLPEITSRRGPSTDQTAPPRPGPGARAS
jgi:hypothetical protein